MGVTIKHRAEVKRFTVRESYIKAVHTEQGVYRADEFVLASGSWSHKLAAKLGIKILLEAGKGYRINSTRDLGITMPAILCESKCAVTPMAGFTRFAGTMELAGTQLNINPKRVNGIVNCVKEFMPQFRDVDFSNLEPWAGLRPCTPDGLPYIGRTKRYDNLLVGTGHAMLGWTLGPITGQLLAQEVTGDDLAVSSPLLEVERYA